MKIQIPEFSLVVLIGTSGSGKSTFARRHFRPTEVLSSDAFRGMVMDDETDQAATKPAFEALHFMLAKRLELGRLTVVDATSVQGPARRSLLEIATRFHALKVAIVLDTPVGICQERNRSRPDRDFGPHVIRGQHQDLRRSIPGLRKEKFHKVYVLDPEEAEAAEIVRERLWSRRPEIHGPLDIIGDIHGCLDELQELMSRLGYSESDWSHPEGRMPAFLGDLVDRGPDSVGVVRRVMAAVKSGRALAVPGNHDMKLARALTGGRVSLNHGLAETMETFGRESEEFRAEVAEFFRSLVSHAVLDDGRLCLAHAGMPASMQGRGSSAVRDFALYGETTGEIDEFGLPVRLPWAKDYRGQALVVYGHTPVTEPVFFNRTINIDTGCCFGGRLTALRYPEQELISVPARKVYAEPKRPMQPPPGSSADDGLLDIADVVGRRHIESRLAGRSTIREENAIAALEVMSRFAADPRWLIHLPPTMSPCETSARDGFLEHPEEALGYYRRQGIESVVCQEKHMGSRALAIVCRNADAAARRFDVQSGEIGAILTRTGRRFFEDRAVEGSILQRLSSAAEASGLFQELTSDWVLLDLEIMPWSAKAIGLLKDSYAPVGAAALAHAEALAQVAAGLEARGLSVEGPAAVAGNRREDALRFRDAYRRYCWEVRSVDDYRLAPFHILAGESGVFVDRSHLWHMETLAALCNADPQILRKTNHRLVRLDSEAESNEARLWWEELVTGGGEGMVVKPLEFLPSGRKGPIQPAVKCRGPEYLRIIYGPGYLEPQNLERLKVRSLSRKRSLAWTEFALGIEALERFLRGEGLRRVHECVFGILALESEPVDPRL
ncbi:MAG: polynucleotide kinase-phosphatase [Fimbriimonadaceae bacterium]|nr:polynucleotide kinase-phosphatase [Fimbriimonadaceae bacterium]